MKNHIIIICAIAALSVASIGFNLKTIVKAKQPEITAETTAAHIYVLKEYHGKIALFTNNSNTPLSVYDIYINTFPISDIKKLESGIYIKSKNELQKTLEEYLS